MQVERRRDDLYRTRIRRTGHPEISRTFKNEADARAWGATMERSIADGTFGEQLNAEKTVRELLELYEREVTPRKRSRETEKNRLALLRRSKLAAHFVKNLRTLHAREYRDQRLKDGLSGSSVNRELALLGHALKWGRAEHDYPADAGIVIGLKRPENPARTRRLQAGEEERLMAAAAPWLQCYITLAIETTCRRSELAGLVWSDVDLQRRVITLGVTKNGDVGVKVPLSTRAVAALERLNPRGIARARLFKVHADTISDCFVRACRLAGITGLRLHDLRAEGVSRLFERGLDLARVRAVSRHKSSAILRYIRAGDVEELAKALG